VSSVFSNRSLFVLLVSLSIVSLSATAAACGSDNTGETVRPESEPVVSEAEIVQPPFPMRGELDGLLLVWFDAEGPHTAQKRSDVPEARRQYVRVDSLSLAPDARLDAAYVYLADLRAAGSDGGYVVRKVTRGSFEALLGGARTAAIAAAQPVVDPNADVVVYGASWCGACRQTEAYLRSRNIPFVERDIERDPAAQQEMTRKAQAAGLNPTGIPVIDFRGQILLGFDRGSIDRLIASSPSHAVPAPPNDPSGGASPAQPI
jgi:glutaredoxin